MAEQRKMGEELEKPKIEVPRICVEVKKQPPLTASSMPSSPRGLRKQASVKHNCLCSPTTHAGSFRCRYHRNTGGLTRNSMSVGSKLSELADKPTGICDALHAQ